MSAARSNAAVFPFRISSAKRQRSQGALAARCGVLAGLLQLVLQLWPALARASCPSAVHLEGEAPLVTPIAQALAQRGVVAEPPAGCPIAAVRVARQGEDITVSLSTDQAAIPRTVSDSTVAAAVIESLLRSDLTDPLLDEPELFEPAPASLLSVSPAIPPEGKRRRLVVGLLLEGSIDTDAAAWLGGSVSVCARVGPLCLGGLLRASFAVPDAAVDAYSDRRLAIELMASAGLPIHLGRVTLMPAIGLGAGILYHQAALSPLAKPESVSIDPTGASDDPASMAIVDGGVRAELGLQTLLRLRPRWFLIGSVSLATAFLDSKNAQKSKDESLPPMSWGAIRGGLGVAWGGP